ncbi:alkyl/aryl-sulfatase [Lentisalinibacter orientalis]|uniref:alkyl/aryl-sulfatase n=1 Tax=Lentisalinibacter orientalis TaxID=2992241 RepID=UPI00386B4ED0
MKNSLSGCLAVPVAMILLAAGCSADREIPYSEDADAAGATAPTAATVESNRRVLDARPFDNERDFERARRGLIASVPELRVGPAERPVWDMTAYEFLEEAEFDSINPSLRRQARLNNIHGLFEVTDGVYQLRGFDLSNMTLIEGETGWIVVDPLTATETAAAAMAFANAELGERPVRAIIFTHSHADHFGGVLGITSAEEVRDQGIRVIAPEGFLEEATSENVIAGVAMGRRAGYMYGRRLPRSPRGHVGSGLGKSPAFGTIAILEPTEIVDRTPQEMTIDGVPFVFQNAPHSEAPAELTFYLPEQKAWCGAEIVSRNMHNIYTLRGAKVRDALLWSGYIDEALQLFGDAEVYFGSHHWPVWGNGEVVEFLKQQRDLYKYIHDQTLRMANEGMTPKEIAEEIALPDSLQQSFANMGYYGTLKHNAKAVYQGYFGWYDGNPANLDPLPPVDAGERYVDYMGGAEEVLRKANASFDEGDYRWVAEVLNHLVMAEPENADARALLARTYDQLGYQAESGPWRDVYLSAAYELRHGPPEQGISLANAIDLLRHTPTERFLDAMAVRLNGPKAADEELTVNLVFTDLGETYVLVVENGVLHHYRRDADPEANATLSLTRDAYLGLAAGAIGLTDLLTSDDITLEGSKLDLVRFFSLLERPEGTFDIVTP